MEQAKDFFDESKDLYELLNAEGVACLSTTTLFKNWTIEDVIGHLYLFNVGAVETLKGCLLYTSPSPRDKRQSRMPSSA